MTNDERPTMWQSCLGSAIGFALGLIVCLLLTLCCSCTRTIYNTREVPVYTSDTIVRVLQLHDSVTTTDSVYIHAVGRYDLARALADRVSVEDKDRHAAGIDLGARRTPRHHRQRARGRGARGRVPPTLVAATAGVGWWIDHRGRCGGRRHQIAINRCFVSHSLHFLLTLSLALQVAEVCEDAGAVLSSC